VVINFIMDSPLFDSAAPPEHYQNSWILPKDLIISSPPLNFMLDMEEEMKLNLMKKADKGSILKKGHAQQSKVKKNKRQKKPFVVSGKSSEKIVQATSLLSEDNVAVAEDENTVALRKCKAIGNGKSPKNMQVGGGKENITTTEDQLIKYLHSILDMDTGALKEQWKEKGVLTKGGAALKHK
jgi:hypothetical protein